jgi:hypothetical protein
MIMLFLNILEIQNNKNVKLAQGPGFTLFEGFLLRVRWAIALYFVGFCITAPTLL